MSENDTTQEPQGAEDRESVYAAIGPVFTTVNEVAKDTKLSRNVVREALTELEEQGTVEKDDSGKQYRRTESPAPADPPADDGKPKGLVEAVRMGTTVLYGRGEVAKSRDETISGMLAKAGSEGVTVAQVAEALRITSGAARHALWRASGHPIHGEPTVPGDKICERVGRSTFVLNDLVDEYKASHAKPEPQATEPASDEADEGSQDDSNSELELAEASA